MTQTVMIRKKKDKPTIDHSEDKEHLKNMVDWRK
jgi:hypothetical protein